MSGDQPATSFGDPNAQSSTPRQTPTSIAFPSPSFETPNQLQKPRFDDPSTSWAQTPRFAEDVSVFNSTPGNLDAAHRGYTIGTCSASNNVSSRINNTSITNTATTPTSTLSTTTPIAASTANAKGITRPRIPSILLNRPLSAGEIAAHIASHVTHFSPSPNLPTVDPSLRLPSSPLPLSSISRDWSAEPDDNPQSIQERARKKARRGTISITGPNSSQPHPQQQQHHPTQTATPPPSARKVDRKLAADTAATSMQDDQGYGQQDFLGVAATAPHGDMTVFTASQHDIFGYPMSAPAGAPAAFWDPSVSMSAMDLDFAAQAAASGILFQTPTPAHRGLDPYDWNSNPALFQEATAHAAVNASANGVPQSSNQENIQPTSKRDRPLAPKPSAPGIQESVPSEFGGAFTTTATATGVENPFALSPSGAVNPGLLYSRPPSSSMDTNANPFNPVSQPEPSVPTLADAAPVAPASAGPDGLQRSFSYKEPTKRGRREPASSPIKPSNPRAGLQRSFSENRGKRQLPTLAPAAMRSSSSSSSQATHAGGSAVGVSSRPSSSSRQSGRISPLKLHHRLTSLSSIPESRGPPPRTRTSVKFTIDARGRAHAETTLVVDEPAPLRRTTMTGRRDRNLLPSDSDDSATDDEPIIIPSRNASFALPDPCKPVGSIFSSSSSSSSSRKKSRKSPRVRASFSFDGRAISPGDDDESEAETVVDDRSDRSSGGGPRGGGGDAASELRKVVEDRASKRAQQRLASTGGIGGFEWGRANVVSPLGVMEGRAMPTPSTSGRRFGIRCICHRNDHGGVTDTFMVQCEACEMWLHGRCINITRREMPPVYICAFCANTPNMRGGRMRDTGGSTRGVSLGSGLPPGGLGHHGHGTSPLAHKSFKSFR